VHNPALLAGLADRVIGLRAGRIAFDLPVAEVNEALLAELYRAAPQPKDPQQHVALKIRSNPSSEVSS
jgi:phosphonate transport system ATP-binding protein